MIRTEEWELREGWWNCKRGMPTSKERSTTCCEKTDSGRGNQGVGVWYWLLLHENGASQIVGACETPCVNAMEQRKPPKNMSYLPPLNHTSPMQDLLYECFTAFAPLCLPKPKASLTVESCHCKTQRPLIPYPTKNPTTFPSI